MISKTPRILVTGGGTFLGDNITAALLSEGAEVTLLVRAGLEDRLGALAQRVRWWTADIWNPASLRGRARGHQAIIHTVGSMIADPAQGLTHHRLNFVSARNAATLCISDGVPQLVLMSSAAAPWVGREYLHSKREAEQYLQRVGVKATVIRAPLAYIRGQPRPPFYALMSALGHIPPTSWLGFRRIAPMPIDVLARGVARLTLEPDRARTIYYASDLWRRNQRDELHFGLGIDDPDDTPPSGTRRIHPFELLDDETPFGWTPGQKPGDPTRRP